MERKDDRRKSCTSKTSYAFRQDAENVASRNMSLHAYRCDYGPHWHVGHMEGTRPKRVTA